jgi:hypothetical protein
MAVFRGATLSLLTVSVTSAWAGDCAKFNAKLDGLQADMKEYLGQLDRVGKIKPLPHTDAALCSSAAKFWHSLENDIADSLACSDKAAHLIESQYKDATVILAQFHCPNPYKHK